jgi:ABC-type glutathione transport system ATPase component
MDAQSRVSNTADRKVRVMPIAEPLLKVEDLVKRYSSNSARTAETIAAVDGVTFSIFSGTTLALVGESGSGKSTLAFCMACLEKPSSGRIWLDGVELTNLSDRELRVIRPKIQLIFQDPASAMNPRWTALQIVTEPLILKNQIARSEQFKRAEALLERVGLSAAGSRRLAEFSGGQRQRLAIARALAAEPKLLILDEAFSALDCSVQAQMVNLLVDLQNATGITCVFITHDLAMAALIADQIAVMEHGRIVECGEAPNVILQPLQECTRALLAAAPRTDQLRMLPENS